MTQPLLDVNVEFDLMVTYQIAIETKSIIISNAPEDTYRYSLVSIGESIPSYHEYINGDDFDELEVIEVSNSMEYLTSLQNGRK